MGITDFHAKVFAQELLRRHASDSVEKLAAALADAQVDLNPHQVEAALFAFRSPFSKGAILADEVGLGKRRQAGPLRETRDRPISRANTELESRREVFARKGDL